MGGSPSSALQRPDLSGAFEEYDTEARQRGFIGHEVLVPIDVALQSANVKKLPLKALLVERETRRNSDGSYARQRYQFEDFNYSTEDHGVEETVDDRVAKIYGDYFNSELIATKRARDAVLGAREKRVADAVFNTTTFASYTTAITHEWDDATNAVPITDVSTARESVLTQCGLIANALIANSKVIENVINTAQVVDRLKYSGHTDPKNVTLAELAKLLFPTVPDARIIVAGAVRNSANPAQAASLARIWSNEYAMIARVANTKDVDEPCLGRLFHYVGDGSDLKCTVESYRDEKVRGDVVRARCETDEKIMYAAAGHLLSNITT